MLLLCIPQDRQNGQAALSPISFMFPMYRLPVSPPPILIEVQHTITPKFIDRLINYSLSVKKCFKAKPTVVVFGTHATRTEISMDFEPTAFEFARGIPSKYWAEKCYILDKNTIAEATKVTPLPTMMALTYFFFFLSKTIPFIE